MGKKCKNIVYLIDQFTVIIKVTNKSNLVFNLIVLFSIIAFISRRLFCQVDWAFNGV